MKFSFLEIAQIELDEAIDYYNYELPGLGDAFLTEVVNAIDRIGEFPEAWPLFKTSEEMSDQTVSVWNYLPNPGTGNPDCNHRESSQKARLLEGSNIDLWNISLEADVHSAVLRSNVSIETLS